MSTTQTTVRTSTRLPRVNLLPPEISEGAKFRTAQMVMGLAVLSSFVVVGALWYLSSGDASAAQDDLNSAQTASTGLQAKVATFAQVPVVYAERATAKAQLDQAMSQEIRYSFVLNDLSLTMPPGVWLTTVTISQPVDAPGTVKGAWGNLADGTVTLSGQANNLPQVAGWLEALARQSPYTDPYLSSTQSSSAGAGAASTTGYTFSSTVSLSAKALSNRYARVDN
jgi:Tfp pilus assembly protein PilN